MNGSNRRGEGPRRSGFILFAVLFVLLALFALSAPFLATARNADASSRYAANEVQLDLALDGAARHARLALETTHPALDQTPYYDDAAELSVPVDFPDNFVDPHDPNGVAWDVEATDLAGRVDLASAPPQVLANLLGAVARLSRPAEPASDSLRVNRASILEGVDVVSLNGELIRLAGVTEDGGLAVEDRGLGTAEGEEGSWTTSGPSPPRGHGVGSYAFDQRVFAPAIWRTLSASENPQVLDAIEEIRASEEFSMSGGFSEADLAHLRRTAVAGTDRHVKWQRPTRIVSPLNAGESYRFYVDQGRWLATGSTVRISDGQNSELRLIAGRADDGRVILDRVVDFDYEPFETQVAVLVRAPVNVNSATVDVLTALFANVKLYGQNHRITQAEAVALARLCVEARPFTGFQDFVERLVLPAGGIDQREEKPPEELEDLESVLDDPRDAVALYYNALNANDARLEFGTMPFSFTTSGLFELQLRATINAPNGIERARGARTRVDDVAPERGELLHLFAFQQDFDAAARLTRGAPYWITGPEPTGRYDSGVTPPSRAIPHLGTLNGSRYIAGVDEPVIDADGNPVRADRVFAAETGDAFCQLDPIRVLPTITNRGRIFHFDQESRSLEGRFLPDEAVVRNATDGVVRWADQANGMAQPLSLKMWVRPETAGDGTLVSLGSGQAEADRVVFGMSGGDLVLRVLDGMGDHRDTPFEEVAEVRFPLAQTAGMPGFPTNLWSHVAIDVRGNRPDQIDVLVNGNATGVQHMGMTRLTSGLSSGSGTIAVESTEGFPDTCVLRIGNEIIEATRAGPNSFSVRHQETGEFTGYGGRLARVRFDVEGTDAAAPLPSAAATITGVYPPGTTVTHYGYSLPLVANAPAGGAQLPAALGPFRVGRVLGRPENNDLEPIQHAVGPNLFTIGRGWSSTTLGPLELQLADAPNAERERDLMAAFNPNGGYALLSGPGDITVDGLNLTNPAGDIVGGVEIIRYSSVTGTMLDVVERGVEILGVGGAPGSGPGGGTGGGTSGGARAFVFDWQLSFVQSSGGSLPGNEILGASTFCIPISIPIPGAGGFNFSVPDQGLSQFAQITRTDTPESTEWVRYDWIDPDAGQLVRNDLGAFAAVARILHGGIDGTNGTTPGGLPGGGPGGGLPGGGGLGGGDNGFVAPLALVPLPVARPVLGNDWDPFRGQDPNEDYPLSRAVSSVLHFRGVLGTRVGEHPAGAPVLPVVPIRASEIDFELGRPGAFDPVFVVDGTATALGFPARVHRAHYPAPSRIVHAWEASQAGDLVATPGAPTEFPQEGFAILGRGYVAFDAPLGVPTSPGVAGGAANITDPRLRARLVKFPSGELPRLVAQAAIGAGAGGLVDFGVPNCTVDEIEFSESLAFSGLNGASPPSHTAGAPMLLAANVGATDVSITVFPDLVRAADGTISNSGPIIGQWPADGGLLRIGEEILAYRGYAGGRIDLAAGGRGLFGTRPQPHQITEPVYWLESWRATTLSAAVGPGDGILPLTSAEGFPREGTVLVGAELIHYTRIVAGGLAMPLTAGDPEELDDEGVGTGAFRGRYGTAPSSHPPGAAVIVFPARYWDRYAAQFDGPELAYFEFGMDQPGAWWKGLTWDAQEPSAGGAEVIVLQNVGTGVPWDGDPEDDPALTLFEDGTLNDDFIPLGMQADRVRWRVFARYAPGSFDPQFGLSHGWKETPRFIRLAATYEARNRVLRSVNR